MASGYAASRPPVHRRVMERAQRRLGGRRFRRALDVGCGARDLDGRARRLADRRIGIEPVEEMLRWAPGVAAEALFAAGTAEAIPVRDGSIDLISAAGALNYAALPEFFSEAERVLAPDGVVLVYDFSPGRAFPRFAGARRVVLRIRAAVSVAGERGAGAGSGLPRGVRQRDSKSRSTRSSKSGYRSTLRVLHRLHDDGDQRRGGDPPTGTTEDEIRAWCSDTLRGVFRAPEREVLFRGYFACMRTRPAG